MDTAKIYRDINGEDCTIHQMVKREPLWAAIRIQVGEGAIEKVKEQEAKIEELTELKDEADSLCTHQYKRIEALENSLRVRNNLLDKYRKDLARKINPIYTQDT